MKNLRFDRHSDDLSGIILKSASSGEEFCLDVDEPLLLNLDRLLEARLLPATTSGDPGRTGRSDSVSSQPPPAAKKPSPDSAAATSTESAPTPTSAEGDRLQKFPQSKADAIAAVRESAPSASESDRAPTIAEAVAENLRARMILLPDEIFDSSWTADSRKGGGWLVKFAYLLGGQTRIAEWVVDDVKREIRPVNSGAEDLERPSKPRTTPASGRPRSGRRRRA